MTMRFPNLIDEDDENDDDDDDDDNDDIHIVISPRIAAKRHPCTTILHPSSRLLARITVPC